MTKSVLKYQSARTEYPADRVLSFIDLAHKIEVLIPNEVWDVDLWQVGSSFVTKGHNRYNRVLAFYNRDATLTGKQEIVGGAPLSYPFKEFTKAYVRYMHSTSPVAFENTNKRLNALQFIEAAFKSLRLEPIIENLSVSVLNTAVTIAREGVGAERHYQFATNIQQIHRFCMERKFLNAPFQWKHGVRKPIGKTEGIGEEAKKWRDEKLPSPEAYQALAHIYCHSESFIDRLYSAVSAILISIPIRIHEVLQLRSNCEVFEKVKNPDNGEMVDAYGIRVFPGKGNPPQVKWVPSQMASIVKGAIARIRDECAEARAVAAWYENNPDKLYLPDRLERFRANKWLTIRDVQEIMGVDTMNGARQLLRTRGLYRSNETDWLGVRYSLLEARLLQELPVEFPYLNGIEDQKYSETLILLFSNQGHIKKGTHRMVVEKATVPSFDQWLSGHNGGKKPSVFEAWGFKERNGSPIRITSHGFRHWLNTVAHLKGLSDMDIAKWSGRKIEQNQAYNHVTEDEVLSQIREAFYNGTGIGPMFEAAKVSGAKRPVDPREFGNAQIGSALITELGICVHDYSLLPCQLYGDCLKCSENVFVKGDVQHKQRIEKRLILHEKQLADALWAMGKDYYGADKWVQSHQKSIEKMKEILAIHNDVSIPDGTIVNLSDGSRDSEVSMALRDRASIGDHLLPSEADPSDTADTVLAGMWEE